MGRAPCCDKANVKRGPWSPEEDSKLKSYIEEHGTGGNWIALPQKIGLKRCGKSCRLRWLNYLRPNIKHGGFTDDEDTLICTLYLSIGSRWSIIAGQLPGRTDNDIKNYWNTKLKKKLLGKQRREQSKRITKQRENYSNNESLRFYPWPAPSQNSQLAIHSPSMVTPQLDANTFSYNNYPTQLEANYVQYVSDHVSPYSDNIQQPSKINSLPSTCPGPVEGFIDGHFNNVDNVVNIIDRGGGVGDHHNSFQAIYDHQNSEEVILYNMQLPQLDQLDDLRAVENMVMNNNTTSTTTISQESDNNNNSLNVYSSDYFPNYEVCINQTKMWQEWTLFDEPRLLGYSL